MDTLEHLREIINAEDVTWSCNNTRATMMAIVNNKKATVILMKQLILSVPHPFTLSILPSFSLTHIRTHKSTQAYRPLQ